VVRDGEGSTLRAWDVAQDSITEHDRRHARLRAFLASSIGDMREVARSVRPHLEGFLRVAFPEYFVPGTLLGRGEEGGSAYDRRGMKHLLNISRASQSRTPWRVAVEELAVAKPPALKLAQEIGKAVAHVTLAVLELRAGGWQDRRESY